MTKTWCELGPPVSISQPLSLEKVEDLWEAWVTWQLLSPGLGLSLLASGLVSCVSCWCEPTRGSSLLRSPPVLLSPFPHRMSCLYSACFRTGSWGSCWKREAWLLMISIQCEQCNLWPISMQCSPVQRHVRLSFKRPRAIDLTLPVKTVPAGKKRRMHFLIFQNIFARTYFTCLWECTVSRCFSSIWSLQLLHWQSWIWQWQVFFFSSDLKS